MANEVTLAMNIAFWVAVWHLLVATYLVVAAEDNSFLLMLIALLKALLGGCIYLIVIQPEWAFMPNIEGFLLPFTLLLLGLVSVVISWLIWQHWELDHPKVRLKKIALKWLFRFRHWYRRRLDEK